MREGTAVKGQVVFHSKFGKGIVRAFRTREPNIGVEFDHISGGYTLDGAIEKKKGRWVSEEYLTVKVAKSVNTAPKSETKTSNKGDIKMKNTSKAVGTVGFVSDEINLFGGKQKIGMIRGDQAQMTPAGIGFRNKDGNIIVFDKATNALINAQDFGLMDAPIISIPVALDQLEAGDIALSDRGNIFFVQKVDLEKGSYTALTISGSVVTKKPMLNLMFNTKMVFKLTSLFDQSGGGLNGALSNPLVMMELMKDNEEAGDSDMLTMLAMSGGLGNQGASSQTGAMNPLMLMAMSGKNKDSEGGIDPITLMAMSGGLGGASGDSNGALGGMNPLALMAISGKNKGSNSGMNSMLPMLMMNQNGGLFNNPVKVTKAPVKKEVHQTGTQAILEAIKGISERVGKLEAPVIEVPVSKEEVVEEYTVSAETKAILDAIGAIGERVTALESPIEAEVIQVEESK